MIYGPQHQPFSLQIHCQWHEYKHRHYSDQLDLVVYIQIAPIITNVKFCPGYPDLSSSPNLSSSFTACFLMRFPKPRVSDRNSFWVAQCLFFGSDSGWSPEIHKEYEMGRKTPSGWNHGWRLKPFTHRSGLCPCRFLYRNTITWRRIRHRSGMSIFATFFVN